jgi:hypothetical protein
MNYLEFCSNLLILYDLYFLKNIGVVFLMTLATRSVVSIFVPGEELEAFLQAPHWQCRGITSCSVHTNCCEASQKYDSIFSRYQGLYIISFQEKLARCPCSQVFYLAVEGNDHSGAQDLAREEHSSYRCYWRMTVNGSWMSGSIFFYILFIDDKQSPMLLLTVITCI